jgi:hypothetical protein
MLAVDASKISFCSHVFVLLLPKIFCSNFLAPNFLALDASTELNASFGWSMRPGDAMHPLSLSQAGNKRHRTDDQLLVAGLKFWLTSRWNRG